MHSKVMVPEKIHVVKIVYLPCCILSCVWVLSRPNFHRMGSERQVENSGESPSGEQAFGRNNRNSVVLLV